MNERIKELSHRAHAWAVGESKFGYHECRVGSDYFLAIREQKFANLIAQDAVNTLRKRWFDANNSIPATSDARLRAIHNGRKIGLMESVDALVEHFGVE